MSVTGYSDIWNEARIDKLVHAVRSKLTSEELYDLESFSRFALAKIDDLESRLNIHGLSYRGGFGLVRKFAEETCCANIFQDYRRTLIT